MAHGALEESGEAFEKAVRLAPNQAEVRNHYGLYLLRVNRVPEAIEQFEAARTDYTYRNPSMILNNLGQALMMDGQTDEAIARLSEAISRSPNLCQPRINRGRAWQEANNAEQALKDYEAAIRLCEASDVSLYYTGSLLIEMGRSSEGCGHLDQARALNPDSDMADRANDLFIRECD